MRIILKLSQNPYNLMRKCGYYFERPASTEATAGKEELVFIRPIGSSKSGYPRFHIYVSRETPHLLRTALSAKNKVSPQKVRDETLRPGSGQAIIINLHLDQKKPIYRGTPAHSAEYEGRVVEKEAERIKKIIGSS